MNKKSALIYSPYLNTLGGGERYILEILRSLETAGYRNHLAWQSAEVLRQLTDRYQINLTQTQLHEEAFDIITTGSVLQKIKLFKNHDLSFFVSDGSLPLLTSNQNFLHFQVPFQNVQGRGLFNQIKLKTLHNIVCNSRFTKHIIDAEFNVDSHVLYPPCTQYQPLEKKNLILSVGRFDNLMQAKRQDVLVESFIKAKLNDWQLVFIGGSLHRSSEVTKLKSQINNHPNIKLLVNASYQTLVEHYGQATFYWHAAGFGSDPEKNPEKMEHFGISIVEAMSAGCIPLAYNGGGPREIIAHDSDGYLWDSPKELINGTKHLIKKPDKLKSLRKKAQQTSQKFSPEHFNHAFRQFLN